MRLYVAAALSLAVLVAGGWRVQVHRDANRRYALHHRRLVERNNLRNIAMLVVENREVPMKDGAFDPYFFVRKGDIRGTNIKLLRRGGSDVGPTEEEAQRGDYAKFPWERYRGEPKPRDARPFPLLWEKAPAEDGRMLVALSDGSVELWDEAAVDRALAEAGVGR